MKTPWDIFGIAKTASNIEFDLASRRLIRESDLDELPLFRSRGGVTLHRLGMDNT